MSRESKRAARHARGHTPFAVVVRLATPVSINHPWLHLDGIIGHLIHQRVLGRDYATLPSKRVEHLPADRMGPYAHTLARTGDLVHASISLFAPEEIGTLQYFKRFEEAGYPRAHKINLASGHYRSWMLRTVYVACETCTFYGCGNVALVRDLLADLTHLGNDTRAGWGKIAALSVAETPEDWSLVRDGLAMRPIPTVACTSYAEAVPLAWRAPYWAAAHVAPCAPPGSAVALG